MIYREADVPTLADRTVFVTGANTGIGYEAARVFAERGARVLLGCRDAEKGTAAAQRIRAGAADAGVDVDVDVNVVALDLASLASVRAAADRVLAEPRLDLLVNNAGVMVPPKTLTADGFESQFGINHLGHFALTGHLLPKLLEQEGSRVVNVASSAHRFGQIDFDDLQAERSYQAGARYGMSKLANILFTRELQRRLGVLEKPTLAVACHPGGADTELGRHISPWMTAAIQPLARLVLNSAAEGALPTLRAATDATVQGGEYFGPSGWFELARGATRVGTSLAARDDAVAQRLWTISAELTGVDPLPL